MITSMQGANALWLLANGAAKADLDPNEARVKIDCRDAFEQDIEHHIDWRHIAFVKKLFVAYGQYGLIAFVADARGIEPKTHYKMNDDYHQAQSAIKQRG